MPPPPWHPNSPVTPWGAPHPAPSARKSVIRLNKKLPSAPLRAPRRFRNPKIGQQLGSTASPPAPLAIRKAPSASVESIQPRPPQPCEVGRPKGRRRKNRRQSHNFSPTKPEYRSRRPPGVPEAAE